MVAFRTLLIANRGEIAVRIARTARALGYRTVAVYSEADADALHVQAADRAVCIGPAPAQASYLSVERLLAAAAAAGAEAIHPGYGFLSENAAFVAACEAAGLVFIGPPAEAVRLMGNKRLAKERMAAAGVPVLPGYPVPGHPVPGDDGAGQDDATLAAAAEHIGFPLMVKAAAGGGGRGMRLVADAAALPAALRGARVEALAAFGSGELLLERALQGARHVEVQVFADAHGAVLHLGERDCSVQRRHQKLIEEAPAPGVTPDLRARMGAAAVAAAQAIGYRGAGTVEFLLDAQGAFYFLEMNTRLQVEHPVTECVTGEDLVAWQLRVAAGEPLPLRQADVPLRGHAMEARLYAEDPHADFLPCTGTVLHWCPPQGEGIRVDHGLCTGTTVGTHYDGLLAKVIAWGETREDARRRLVAALEDTVLLGVTHNAAFLANVLQSVPFAAGRLHTGLLEDPDLRDAARSRPLLPPWLWALAAALLYEGSGHPAARWALPRLPAPLRVAAQGLERAFLVHSTRAGSYKIVGPDRPDAPHAVELATADTPGQAPYALVDGIRRPLVAVADAERLWIACDGWSAAFQEPGASAGGADAAGVADVVAPLNGRVLSVAATAGAAVRKGQPLVVLEAMKLQHELSAATDGTIARIAVQPGEQVVPGQLLVEIHAAAAAAADTPD